MYQVASVGERESDRERTAPDTDVLIVAALLNWMCATHLQPMRVQQTTLGCYFSMEMTVNRQTHLFVTNERFLCFFSPLENAMQ